MDTKRLMVAVVLSIVVIVVWSYFFGPKPVKQQPVSPQQETVAKQPVETQSVDQQQTPKSTPSSENTGFFGDDTPKEKPVVIKTEAEVIGPVTEDVFGETVRDQIVVETDLYRAVFTNKGGGLTSFILKNYKEDKKTPLGDGQGFEQKNLDLISQEVKGYGMYPFHFWPREKDGEFFASLNKAIFYYQGSDMVKVSGSNQKEIVFKYQLKESNLSVIKRFIFSGDSYVIGSEYEIIENGQKKNAPVIFGPDLENNSSPLRVLQMGLKIASYDGNDINKVDFRKVKTKPIKEGSNIQTAEGGLPGFSHWVAFETTYFAAIFKTSDQNAGIKYYVRKEKIPKEKNVQWKVNSYMVVNNPTHVYIGPKDEAILATVDDVFFDVNKVVEYGFFGPIAKIMLKGIMLSYKVIPNYGWAIILFTLILKLLLFPLTYTSSVSMAKMQALQPKIKAIKKKYKNQKDPEQRRQMNVETMALYKQEKVNPAGGCLPMLLQLPILFGIFMLLKVSINIRHEPWIMWIKDLSVKDPIYLIPILMGITQILLQKMSPSTGDSSQKKMMYLMPVVITFFVANLPSGLTLYWFVSNLLQMGQQHFINKKIFQQKKDEEKARKSLKRKKGAKVK